MNCNSQALFSASLQVANSCGASFCRLTELDDGTGTLCREPGRYVYRQGELASPLFNAKNRDRRRLARDGLAKRCWRWVAKRDPQRLARHHGAMPARQLMLKHGGHGLNKLGYRHLGYTQSRINSDLMLPIMVLVANLYICP